MINSRQAKILISLGGVAVISILLSIFSAGSSEVPPLKVGDVVPDLKLVGSDGKSYSFRKIVADGDALVVAGIPKAGTPG